MTHALPPLPPLRLLEDAAGLWTRVVEVLGGDEQALTGEGAEVIGVVTWVNASRAEVGRLDELRAAHDGALVAVLQELPTARGARAVSTLLEGCVLADELERALTPTLAAVAAGQSAVPRELRRVLERPPLSPRERQVLAMVVLDFTNAEIARKLVVTESNVKSHLTSAFSKLGVSSRNEAVDLILDNESGLGPGILRFTPQE